MQSLWLREQRAQDFVDIQLLAFVILKIYNESKQDIQISQVDNGTSVNTTKTIQANYAHLYDIRGNTARAVPQMDSAT